MGDPSKQTFRALCIGLIASPFVGAFAGYLIGKNVEQDLAIKELRQRIPAYETRVIAESLSLEEDRDYSVLPK